MDFPVEYLIGSENGGRERDEKDLQVTGNLSHLGFEAAKNHHCLPTRLCLDLLNGQLYSGRKVVDCTMRCDVSIEFRLTGSNDVPLDMGVLSEQFVPVFVGFRRPREGIRFLPSSLLFVNPILERGEFFRTEEAAFPMHNRNMEH
jgi:hypothetical protein